jgi:hypothetical protein
VSLDSQARALSDAGAEVRTSRCDGMLRGFPRVDPMRDRAGRAAAEAGAALRTALGA